MVGLEQKLFFLQLCYLIRVENEKCSEMCVWIVRFSQKLRKWDCFWKDEVLENFLIIIFSLISF